MLTLAATAALPAPAPTAPATSDGNYTVTYTPCADCIAHWLEEKAPDDTWRAVPLPATFENRSDGTYLYRAAYQYVDYVTFSIWIEYSPWTSVEVRAVSRIPRPSLGEQLSYRYEVRTGDLDADGRQDVLIDRPGVSAAGDGTLGPVLLRGLGNGSFEPRTPGQALATARTWPAVDVGLTARDVNIDGYVDVVLTDLADVPGLAAAFDQILFAPGAGDVTGPGNVRAFDANLARFGRDIHSYLQDPDYFPDNAAVTVTLWTYTIANCMFSGYDDLYGVRPCLYVPVQYVYVVYDYSQFTPDAVEIWESEAALRSGEIAPEQAFGEIEARLEALLDIDLGGWDIEDLLGDQADVLDDVSRRGTELFAVLAGIASARADEVLESEQGEATSLGDNVILAARRIIGFGPLHTVLEYAGSTISANDSDPRALFDGTLVSAVDWPSDDPALTMKIAPVVAPLTPALYWGRLLAADAAYDDDLPYDKVPSIGAGGYNSNSYTSGIINATNGVAGVPMTRFIGGELPVPPGEFY